MTSYYNDNDPTAAAWLRELIAADLIPQGDVDDRSILEIEPADLVGYDHVHFFAGIGGWAYALRLVGWPDDRPVWTGSPPCQPFSVAGKQAGRDDERHLAPHFLELVTACRPPVIFGEQVASSQVFGKVAGGAGKCAGAEPEWAWIDDVSLHLEEAHYAFGASDLPAAGVGAPHQRQRCFFGAYDLRSAAGGGAGHRLGGADPRRGRGYAEPAAVGALADCRRASDEPGRHDVAGAPGEDQGREEEEWQRLRDDAGDGGNPHRLADATGGRCEPRPRHTGVCYSDDGATTASEQFGIGRSSDWLADSDDEGPQGRSLGRHGAGERAAGPSSLAVGQPATGPTNGFWRDADWLRCTDDKWRPVEPGAQPLAHGIPDRVALLRGAGNAIVPEVAAKFIVAFEEARQMTCAA